MIDFLLTSAVIFAVLTVWLYVDHRYRRFANENPALGPFRPEAGCGDGCSCSQGSCGASRPNKQPTAVSLEIPRAEQATDRE